MILQNPDCGGYYVTQRQWTPTKPRAPISADFQTPGPGSFNIPSTIGKNANQVVKGKSPSYTFGAKIEEKTSKVVPGPGSYNIAGLSEKGKDTCAAPTIAAKLKEPEPFKTPAPGAYNPDKSDCVIHIAAPRYTFGSKLKEHAPDDIPGCVCENRLHVLGIKKNIRTFEGLKRKRGKKDEFYTKISTGESQIEMPPSCPLNPGRRSLTRERSRERSTKSPQSARVIYDCDPGPGYYEPERADAARYSRTPGFSIRGRSHSPPPNDYPSPAEYTPERADPLRYASPPRYSFGSRLRDHEGSEPDPAPNSYRIERADNLRFRSPPRWSFRCSRPIQQLPDTPPPNSYRVESCDKQRYPSPPKHSIRGNRNSFPSFDKEREDVPGPGHYEPSFYGTIPRAVNLANKLEPPNIGRQQQHLRYLKRADADLPPKFKFIDDPIDEPVKRKRSEQKRSWFPSFASVQLRQTKLKKTTGQHHSPEKTADKNEKSISSSTNNNKEIREEQDNDQNPQSLKGRVGTRSSWTSPLKQRHSKSGTNFPSQGKTQNFFEPLPSQSSTAAQPSTLTSRPLSWAERSLVEGRRESRPLERDRDSKGKKTISSSSYNNKCVSAKGGKTKSLLKRSLSFGARDRTDRREDATAVSGGPTATFGPRRGHSVESLRMMPPCFESYCFPTKSFAQKTVYACSVGGDFERWPSLRRMRDTTPAPGEYYIERADPLVRPVSPAYSFGGRPAERRPRTVHPAPCDYLPDRADHMVFTSAPSFSFRSKTADPEVIFNERFFNAPFSPFLQYITAPGKYNPPPADAYKKKSPSYSLSYRTTIPTDHTAKPGPGQYTPERVFVNKLSAPRFSFGIRHSPCAETK
ncbi:uncharacterized protein LOC111254201 [Varroa destructor]|uniref:Uncharacterized protein n=1 Tax=Varroa destructor TaxID=109461 RepID=A0A7M7KTE8_VARDE|nr:uncharacterized protein LOC111254201 [Varroa destructor]